MNPDDFERLRSAVEKLTLVTQQINARMETMAQHTHNAVMSIRDILMDLEARVERLEKMTGVNR